MPPVKDRFLFRELQVIQKIIQDETWLEGERRGCWVSPEDPAVRERVCAVVLRIGQELREAVTKAMDQKVEPTTAGVVPEARQATAA